MRLSARDSHRLPAMTPSMTMMPKVPTLCSAEPQGSVNLNRMGCTASDQDAGDVALIDQLAADVALRRELPHAAAPAHDLRGDDHAVARHDLPAEAHVVGAAEGEELAGL